ncbi:MAG TPA: CPBP family glutamic-type intramembrane protease, partial [Gemmataceae bacterium]|nr:CPBP family glutamic-type intramembrane protease [Gemmataceae bacterium]
MLDPTELYAWLMCAAPCAAVVLAWWVARRSGGPSLFPPQRSRAVPWSGFEVFVVYFLYYFFWVFALNSLLEASGFLTWLYHTPAPALTTENLENPAIRLALNRRMLWAEALAVPFNLATALMFPARMCGTRPYQLGLTRWRCGLTLVAGCLVWLMLTPCVEGVQFVTVWAYMQFTSTQPEPHPLVTLIQTGQVLPAEWAVLTFITVLGAPVLEEVVFRGVIQRWAGSHTTAGNLTMVAAACIAAWAWPNGHGPGPLVFVLAMVPLYVFIEHLLWRWLPRPDVARGIFATALFFGAAHSF